MKIIVTVVRYAGMFRNGPIALLTKMSWYRTTLPKDCPMALLLPPQLVYQKCCFLEGIAIPGEGTTAISSVSLCCFSSRMAGKCLSAFVPFYHVFGKSLRNTSKTNYLQTSPLPSSGLFLLLCRSSRSTQGFVHLDHKPCTIVT